MAHSLAEYAGYGQIQTVAHRQVARAAPSLGLPATLHPQPHLTGGGSHLLSLETKVLGSQGSQEGWRMYLTAPLPPHAQHCAEGSAGPSLVYSAGQLQKVTVLNLHASLKPRLLPREQRLRRGEVIAKDPRHR